MPLFHEDPSEPSPQVVVSGSVAVELDWVLAAAWRPEFARDHAGLARAYERSPELREQVRSFWGPGEATSCGGSIELMILAHHAGLLDCLEPAELLEHLEDACANAPTDLRLASETEEDRLALLARLSRLRTSPGLRRRYVQLVRDVWAAVTPDWERDGKLAVSDAVRERRELSFQGATWEQVAANPRCDEELKSELVASLGPGGTVHVVPAFFAHLGSLVDLPGTVLVGVRADGSSAQARARTELLARRLKTISDPTRLAILEALRGSPRSVTELATHFSLAQPTVSNHVKLLRDAGIVSNGADGDRRKLVLQPDVLADLLAHLEEFLTVPRSQLGA